MVIRIARPCGIVLVATVVCPFAAGQEASFRGLGVLGSVDAVTTAHGVSGDGDIVCGQGNSFETGPYAFRWTELAGLEVLPPLAGSPGAAAFGISDDGHTIVGSTQDGDGSTPRPVRWIDGGAAEDLVWELESILGGTAIAASPDGTVIVGHLVSETLGGPIAARWEGSEVRTLEPADPGVSTAEAVSADGTSIFGGASDFKTYFDAARWQGDRYEALFSGYVRDCSASGLQAVGINGFWSGDAVQWSSRGEVTTLAADGDAWGISADGAIVVGYSSGTGAFVWDAMDGARSVAAVLAALDVDLTGWTLDRAYSVSADGTTIVGEGLHDGVREAWRAVIPRDLDTDGDGLLDDWEINGIPYVDSAGVDQRFVLSGAEWWRKDLYVEIDAMTGFAPPSLADVVAAFASAPVENPQGPVGVTLHVVVDETDLPHTPIMTDTTGMPEEFAIYRETYFGTPTEHGPAGDPGDVPRLEARAKAFRYCLFADRADRKLLGKADAIWGNNLIVFAGEAMTNPDICFECTGAARRVLVRTSFMHEFGHCLELRHGGDDNDNYKPNYMSVMNYQFQVPFKLGSQRWRLDYSQGLMPNVSEDGLDEAAGFGHPSLNGRSTYHGETPCSFVPCGLEEIGPTIVGEYVIGSADHDFNGDGAIESSTCADLNYFGVGSAFAHGDVSTPCDVHVDFNDWAHLRYELRSPGAPAPGELVVELTADEIAAILGALPDPCRGDVAPGFGDGAVGVEDLLLVLSSWGACEGCAADLEPHLVADGMVDVQDLLVLLSNWGECP